MQVATHGVSGRVMSVGSRRGGRKPGRGGSQSGDEEGDGGTEDTVARNRPVQMGVVGNESLAHAHPWIYTDFEKTAEKMNSSRRPLMRTKRR